MSTAQFRVTIDGFALLGNDSMEAIVSHALHELNAAGHKIDSAVIEYVGEPPAELSKEAAEGSPAVDAPPAAATETPPSSAATAPAALAQEQSAPSE